MRLGIITDTHFAPPETTTGIWHNPYRFAQVEDYLGRALSWIGEQGADAIVVLGDLTNVGDQPSIERVLGVLATALAPVTVIPGNHDADAEGSPWRALTSALPEPGVAIGRVSTFEHDPDSGNWIAPATTIDVSGNDVLVVASHPPLLDRQDEIAAHRFKFAGAFAWRDGDRLLQRDAPTVVLHGHLHIRMSATEGSVLQLGFASLIEPPHAVSLVDIDTTGNQPTVRVEHTSVDPYPIERLPVLSPDTETWIFTGEGWTTA